ncbi:MAG: PolC-type DNA polymerase III [Lachnospiraceae bacterium]|nr:PolC-type DNA polymerase III [Lachnospiraceae bacterium]
MTTSEKPFFEVFRTIEAEGPLKKLLDQVVVTRVSTNPQRDVLRVYITSRKLIAKHQLFQLAAQIQRQVFAGRPGKVWFFETFQLSEQYTPERLWSVYADSVLTELEAYSPYKRSILKNAKVEFPDEHTLTLGISKHVYDREAVNDIARILDRVFNERCGLRVKVDVEYYEPEEESGLSKGEAEMRQRIAALTGELMKSEQGVASPQQPLEGSVSVVLRDTEEGGGASGEERASFGQQTPMAAGENAAYGQQTLGTEKSVAQGKQTSSGGGKTVSGKRGSSLRGGSGRGKGGFYKKTAPDMLYGRSFDDEPIQLREIVEEMGEVTVRGKIRKREDREIRGERTILTLTLTDFTDSINVKLFTPNERLPELEALAEGTFVKLKGVTILDRFDHELTIGSVTGIKKIADFTSSRMDYSAKKRVELHCHTKMSDMDGVTDAAVLLKRAKAWGMPALAITDHGCVQAFTEASHTISKDEDFKVIYGVEGYLVDDLKELIENSKGQSLDDAYVVFDLETTGLSAVHNRIIEIGAVKVEKGQITERFSSFVNPREPIPFEIEELTGIDDDMVLDAPPIEEILPEFLAFCEGCVLIAHNASFDAGFIEENCRRMDIPTDFTVGDTVAMARVLLPKLNKFKLDTVAKALNIPLDHHHRAVDDAACTAEIFLKFLQMFRERDARTLDDVNELGRADAAAIKKLPTYHVIILAKNDIGRVNLYRLVSLSHIDYFARRPRIPKSELEKYRAGLIVGSACEAGELYQAILRGAPRQEIARIVEFYDYLEIQPLGNNAFMLRDSKNPVSSEEDLRENVRTIVRLGEEFHKPVAATCDVHFIDPEDEVYRRIIMAGKGFADADQQAPLYLRTTEEMLAEFEFLGAEKAEEVVITNTNLISEMCEHLSPVRPDKCPPVIADSDKTLREICYNKAHEIYGEELPEIVTERLERELRSIIGNGFAVMYIIAQKLVWKSNEDGYLVGSRGSVGSSLVATMAGITEVNPLSPHYICPKCHYSDFESDEVKKYAGMAGCDMPDRNCPRCGEKLKKEGFDIPFETFLGFKGNKEPDIDLNFSGDYQSRAHKYTEVIFGTGQTFRAGTIGTLADKTAFGYVKNYYEERGVPKRRCEIERIVDGCVGVRRTTGQHPGGIIVLPLGESIYSFTPVQHPANDMTTDIITTHFDYHSIDHNLLKLDILGHDDPTMIRMLEDLTGVNAREIPLDDPQVMSLFQSTEALGIRPEDIGGTPLGSLGIPEFGTEFAMQMLVDTHPTHFSDLVRIAGLAHGTDVWLGNAQTLIQEGKATISTAICTRDDIMTYLISMGLDSELSFKIMEAVRKGKVAKGQCDTWPEWKEEMIAHGVPDWYIWSCEKIKYMFPKAHAAAYVMMAWRIAWCKINFPLEYYAAYFSIRASAFNYELMCQGRERLERYIQDYRSREDDLTQKEKDTLKDMMSVLEMYARGYEFCKLDIYEADARKFRIIDGKLMPSLSTIDGLGDKAADAFVEGRAAGPFLSRDDLRNRTKLSKTVIDLMGDLGLLDGLPESDQLSIFDFG